MFTPKSQFKTEKGEKGSKTQKPKFWQHTTVNDTNGPRLEGARSCSSDGTCFSLSPLYA